MVYNVGDNKMVYKVIITVSTINQHLTNIGRVIFYILARKN